MIYEHHFGTFADVTMTKTSTSVYLAGATGADFAGKYGDGFSGDEIGNLEGGCKDLNNFVAGRRLSCVRVVT